MGIFTNFFKNNGGRITEQRRQEILQDLMRRESKLAQGILGTPPKGGRRDFFCLDETSWIWYEEWTTPQGVRNAVTTKYVIRQKDILKSIDGGTYHKLSDDEMINFKKATDAYVQRAKANMYAPSAPKASK